MSFVTVAVVGGAATLGGAIITSNAAQNAADTQANAASNANNLQYSEFQQQQQNQQPWMQAGVGALGQLQDITAQGAPQFTAQDFLNNQDPGYAFNLQQGQQAIQRSAAASGGLNSGGTLKALSQYSQGQASNEYQNAYQRFMNGQNTQVARLQSLAGLGQTATGMMGQAGQNYANQSGQNMMGAANAQGAAGIAGANAWSGALGNLSSLGSSAANYGIQSQMLNNFYGNGMSNAYGAMSTPTEANNFGAAPLSMSDIGSQFGGGAPSLYAGGAT